MNAIEHALAEFGHSIGLGALPLGDAGGTTLQFGDDRQLGFRAVDGGLLMLLAAPLGSVAEALPRKLRALDLCHWRHARVLQVQSGISRDGALLVLMARLPDRGLGLPTIEQALDLLVRLHEQVQG